MHPMRSLAAAVLAVLITSCSSSSHERLCNRFFTPYPDLVSQRARNKLNGEFLDAMALYAKGQYAEAMPGLQRVVVDEVHAFATGKRGDLLALSLARLQTIAPAMRRVALSATLADPDGFRAWLAPGGDSCVELVEGEKGAAPEIEILLPKGERVPWGGHAGSWAIPQLLEVITRNRTTLVFTNTRFLAEYVFQLLWAANDANLPIGIHHGSLAQESRRKVEGAMAGTGCAGVRGHARSHRDPAKSISYLQFPKALHRRAFARTRIQPYR